MAGLLTHCAVFLAVCLVSTQAKPHYQSLKPHSEAKVFQDALSLPPISSAGYVQPEARGHWMAWDPNHHVTVEDEQDAQGSEVTDLDDLDLFRDEEMLSPAAEPEDFHMDPAKLLHEAPPAAEVRPTEQQEEQQEEEEEMEPMPGVLTDPCIGVYCHLGRVCRTSVNGIGECVCGDVSMCVGHDHQVCGTDGHLYSSHCELHRQACVQGRHISIDHTNSTCSGQYGARQEERVTPGHRHHKQRLSMNVEVSYSEPSADETEADEPSDETEADNGAVNVTSERAEPAVEQQTVAIPEVTTTAEPLPEVYCNDLEYDRFKGILIQYHCARIGETKCQPDSPRKQFVANIMFNYYDRDGDQQLSESELVDIEHRDHLEKLSVFCSLVDVLEFDDANEDANITITEFYKAFNVPTVILDENLRTFTTVVTAGNSIELKCDIQGATNIVWHRNGIAILEENIPDMKTFDEGFALYISKLGLHHMGNYTCRDALNPHVIQTHVLHVQLPPTVQVSPSTQFHTTGATVQLKCHAEGVPQPEISWQMNEAELPEDADHYIRLNDNATLEIRKAVYTKDTGAYKCQARNTAGVGQDIATVFIENGKVPQYSTGNSEDLYEVFVVFHDRGYHVYEPMHCHIKHQVLPSFSLFRTLPDYGQTLSTLCEAEHPCSWGEAVNVDNKFIYVTQPKLHRVVVIEIQDRSNPIEVIPTDRFPVALHYIEHLDAVWVECWNEEEGKEGKTLIVIRQASQDMQHHIVHTQPVGNRFDLIDKVFLPTNNDLKQSFEYGYVSHVGQQGLHKIHLHSLQYVHTIDLTPQACVPQQLTFIPLGGVVRIDCASPAGEPDASKHLSLDYITDAVLAEHAAHGRPLTSPDGRYLIVLDDEGKTITVSSVNNHGDVEKLYTEYTNMDLSDVAFFPADHGHGYDLFASSDSSNQLLYMNLKSGTIQLIEAGVGQAMPHNEWQWSHQNRVIRAGGVFGEYLMSPSRDSVVVIDGRRRHVQCEWRDIMHGNVIVWVEPRHL